MPVDGVGACDDDALHAGFDGGEGILNLGYHAAGDGAVGGECLEAPAVVAGDDAVLVVGVAQHAFLLEAVDQRHVKPGSECPGCL